ncbi:hypothetical protein BG000_004230 [Podila horticola]|nr:hypothetical protein BG000_004230 [Podila horticola]
MGSIEPQYLSERFVYVKASPAHGMGLFARHDLAPGTVWWYPEAETSLYIRRDLYHRIRVASKYYPAWGLLLDAIDIYSYYDSRQDALVFCLCNARYCNHDDAPNSVPALEASEHYDAVRVVGMVKKGQEIFENYHAFGHPVWARSCNDFLNPQLGDREVGFENEEVMSGEMEIVLSKEQVATYLRSHRETDVQQSFEICWKEFGVAENGGWRIVVPDVAREP